MTRAWAVALACVACGGQLVSADGGQDASVSDGAAEASEVVTYDACSGSDGIKLCGGECGQNQCSIEVPCNPPNIIGACYESGSKLYLPCAGGKGSFFAADGTLCVPLNLEAGDPPASGEYAMIHLNAADPGYAVLYAKHGFGNYCRYADRAVYDGTAIPAAPTTCPSVDGFQLCGGACGDCPAGEYCTGRSPLHPVSICMTDYSEAFEPQTSACVRGAPLAGGCMGNAQTPPSACLTFKVSDADQPFSDQNGICTERSMCLAAASGYPGGAYCTP